MANGKRVWILALLMAMVPVLGMGPLSAAEQQAGELLDRVGVRRGLCVVLDPQPAGLALDLAQHSELILYVQLPDDEAVAAARARLDEAGLLGSRVYVEKGPWSHIHLADNLADAVIVTPRAAEVAAEHRDELLRVVHPLGKVLLGNQEISKPSTDRTDDWTHPYHGPDNNPQSTDQLARAPYLTQFQAEPWYIPFPTVTVASQGRIFKAMGHIAFKRREWPWLNTLVAINGYNGTLLWKRPLEEGFNIHRNTMIATPEVLYLGDSKSCKRIDTATGELIDAIVAPEGSTGKVWKWMALVDGTLYALVGQEEFRDRTRRDNRPQPGWPWQPMTKGYDGEQYRWGFGRTLLALDPKTKEVRWMHTEPTPIDGRAVCMKGGRIYYYAHPKFLACLDAKRGQPLWRTSDPELLEAIGPHFRAQTWLWGFSTTAYMKCNDEAVYFAGPQRERLVAVCAKTGKLLWQYPEGNFQIVLRDDGLYAMGSRNPSKKFDLRTGKVLADLGPRRAACTRATGTIDSIFTRGETPGQLGNHAGTLRLVASDHRPLRIALMRPPCHDGVITAGGLLHWGPWMCDCNLSLFGNICLAPAGDFDFEAQATDAQRLEADGDTEKPPKPLTVVPGDWPTYRADNQRSAASPVDIPEDVSLAWQVTSPAPNDPTAPVTAGGLVFASGADGIVQALDAASGRCLWKAYTGGRIYYPPAIDQGRLIVGSGDGWVHAFEAATGRRLWRFRAAPAQRKIPLYGRLSSTWPVASGTLVDGPTVYAAAGIASYDGTHVYALDAGTGRIRWQNNTSGHLAGDGRLSGVSVQGHLLLHDGRLYLAGGNVVSPAMYDVEDGRCLNSLEDEWVKSARGRELFLVDGEVVAFDWLLYSPAEYQRGRRFAKHFLQAQAGQVIIRGNKGRIVRIDPAAGRQAAGRQAPADAKPGAKKPRSLWESKQFEHAAALALGNNAVVVAGRLPGAEDDSQPRYAAMALGIDDGQVLWAQSLAAMPKSWGLALDGAGRVVVALANGDLVCFARPE